MGKLSGKPVTLLYLPKELNVEANVMEKIAVKGKVA